MTSKPSAAIPSQPESENSVVVNVERKCQRCGGAGYDIAVPADAEEGLSEWLTNLERNQLQNERDAEERAMFEQVQLQEETDDT